MSAQASQPVMRNSEVVFMYPNRSEVYQACGATFVAWGGAGTPEGARRHRDLGIRCTGTMWCLTPGSHRVHDDPAFRNAVVIDAWGEPVGVPWLFDSTYLGTPSYFGCTNNPTFQKLCRDLAAAETAGHADGLHIDDPRGTTTAALQSGGCFCQYCRAGFREYLRGLNDPAVLDRAGVKDLNTFDYLDVARKHAASREEYIQKREQIPLAPEFIDYQAQAAADNIHNVAQAAIASAGRPILISVNAFELEESFLPIIRLPEVTHVICEVPQHANEGVARMDNCVRVYRLAERLGKPVAVTASGHDWAWVKAHDSRDLPKTWIALAYAFGTRFMVPARQWCFTEFLGTHWYQAPNELYAPLYRWIRDRAVLLDDFAEDESAAVEGPAGVYLCPRRHADGRRVLHAVNARLERDSHTSRRMIQPIEKAEIAICGEFASGITRAVVHAPDAEGRTIPATADAGRVRFAVPDMPQWTMLELL